MFNFVAALRRQYAVTCLSLLPLLLTLAACTSPNSPTTPSPSPTVPVPPVVVAPPVPEPPTPTPPLPVVVAIADVSVTPSGVYGGRAANGTVTLTAPAPQGGTVVTLTSSDRDVRLPATITIAAGATTGSFTVATSEPHVDTPVTITAAANGSTRSISIVLLLEPPVARNDSYEMNANGTLYERAPGVLANDERRTGHELEAELVTRPGNGTVTLERSGQLTYRPNAGFGGRDSFSYRAVDGMVKSNIATVTVNVIAPAEVPVVVTSSQTFSFTGGAQTFTVPAGVTRITIHASGAEGGTALNANPGVGGRGGSVEASLTVTAGTVYQINVGGRGTNGTAGVGGGAGGGGASDVRSGANALSDRVLVAGGGGGGGIRDLATAAGDGGNGGGTTAVAGESTDQGAGGGGAGTSAAGGAGGGGGQTGSAGASGQGGAGAGPVGFVGVAGGFNGGGRGGNGGAGGGGGFFGGGGGGTANSGGGGGGGSSFVIGTATGVTHQQGARSGNGEVRITWVVP